jgi:hypothetical protein
MQTAFKNKKIDKPIPVEKLVKCKMQCVFCDFFFWRKIGIKIFEGIISSSYNG